MKKFLNTISFNIKPFISSYLLPALAVSAIILFLKIFFSYYKQKNTDLKFKDYIKDELKNHKNIIFFATMLYFSTVYQSTVISRIGHIKQEPLSNIFGGWEIYSWTYFYDFTSIWNILMFLPMAVILHFNYKQKGTELEKNKLIILSTVFSFLASAVIEILQIILCVGTFQISDLVYNTLGGLIGAIVFILIKNTKS